ncbi:hypothetical protein D3C76_1483160 [compost metagenome]
MRTTVAFAEGVYDVDVGIGLCHSDDQLSPLHALEPVCRGHVGEDLIGFLLHVLRLAEAGGLFGHANGAQLSGPFEQVRKENSMNVLKVGQAVGRRAELDVVRRDGPELLFGFA